LFLEWLFATFPLPPASSLLLTPRSYQIPLFSDLLRPCPPFPHPCCDAIPPLYGCTEVFFFFFGSQRKSFLFPSLAIQNLLCPPQDVQPSPVSLFLTCLGHNLFPGFRSSILLYHVCSSFTFVFFSPLIWPLFSFPWSNSHGDPKCVSFFPTTGSP